MNDIKVKMFGKHFCNIPRHFMLTFEKECKVINFSAWVREQAYFDFKINLISADSLIEFNSVLNDNFYSNIGEWVREKMRIRLKEAMDNEYK